MIVNEELGYDIEQLWIEGVSDVEIAEQLGIGVEVVEGWITANGLNDQGWEIEDDEEYYNPFNTVNS